MMCWSASTCCREGLDIPEVSLIAILDADKEGFLRSERSLIQIIGRAARNAAGKSHHVCRYDHAVNAQSALMKQHRRREIQMAFNEEHGITPKTIIKPIHDVVRSKETKEMTAAYMKKKNKMAQEGQDKDAGEYREGNEGSGTRAGFRTCGTAARYPDRTAQFLRETGHEFLWKNNSCSP